METDLTSLARKHVKRKRFIAISYIVFGSLITSLMMLIVIWPGALTSLFWPDMSWVEGDSVIGFFLNTLLAVGYFALLVGLMLVIGAAPLIALPIMLIIGIPSLLGGIYLLRNKRWAMKLLVFESVFFLFLFPLGTWLAIVTFRFNNRENKYKTLL